VRFRGVYRGQISVIVKFFYEKSDANNEFNILGFLSDRPNLEFIPKPIAGIYTDNADFEMCGKIYKGIYLMLIYVSPGELPFVGMREISKKTYPGCYEDLRRQMQILHSFGLVLGFVSPELVAKNSNGYYGFYDYGRAISASNKPFPFIAWGRAVLDSATDFAYLDHMFVE